MLAQPCKYYRKKSEFVKNKADLNINILGYQQKIKKKRIFTIKKYRWIQNPIDLLNIDGKKPDILVELIGYEKDISYELVKSALKNKINVVTGNKAMLAKLWSRAF